MVGSHCCGFLTDVKDLLSWKQTCLKPCTSAFVAAARICILLHTRVCCVGFGCFPFFFFFPSCCMLEYNFGQGKESNNIVEERYLHQLPLSVLGILMCTWARHTVSKSLKYKECAVNAHKKWSLFYPDHWAFSFSFSYSLADTRRVASPFGFQVLSSSSRKGGSSSP